VDSLTIEYSTNGGTGWNPISSGEANDSSFSWVVPVTPSDSCLVRITGFDPSLNIGQDVSDTLFRISDQTSPAINVIYPNGGENWVTGAMDSIQWVASDLFGVDSLSLYLSLDGGGSWYLLSSGEPNDSLYTLTTPCPPTDSALVRIIAYDPSINSGEDTSDSLFLISDLISPQVTLNYPNGGDFLEVGDQDTIQWVASDNCAVDFLNLFLSTDGGGSWSPITTGEVNDSTYLWTIPYLLSDSCLIRIVSYDFDSNTNEDTSDAIFTIQDQTLPQVVVVYPNGGESFNSGDSVTIQWVASDNGIIDSLTIFFSSDGGSIWDTLAAGEANDSSYLWIIPSISTTQGLIRILAFDGALNAGEDQSDSTFTILLVGAEEEIPQFPTSLRLFQNQPNPFHNSTLIRYSFKRKPKDLCALVSLRHYGSFSRKSCG
jgi:hypothetical protein